jgi:hypothetical protein
VIEALRENDGSRAPANELHQRHDRIGRDSGMVARPRQRHERKLQLERSEPMRPAADVHS